MPHRAVDALHASAAAEPAQATKWTAQAGRLVRRRAGLSQRWDAAFATLHAELGALRGAIAAWAAGRPHGAPPAAPTAAVPMSCA